MISMELIKKDAKKIQELLAKKGCNVDFSQVLNLDTDRRKLIQDVEALKSQKNKVSSQIPMYKKEGKDTAEIFAQMKELGNKIEELDKKVAECDEEIWKFLAVLPNPPDEDLLEGGKENNKVLRQVNEKPVFNFEPKNSFRAYHLISFLLVYCFGIPTKFPSSINFWAFDFISSRLMLAEVI